MTKQIMAGVLAMAVGLMQPGLVTVSAQAPQEGIQVHGRWAIDVRAADGTLVTHRDFENDFVRSVPDGRSASDALAHLLAGGLPNAKWGVVLDSTTAAAMGDVVSKTRSAPCDYGLAIPLQCLYSEVPGTSSAPGTGVVFKPLLTKTVNGGLVLSVTDTATYAGTIETVGTVLFADPHPYPTQSVATPFTFAVVTDPNTKLPAPIPVAAGQIMQISVVISFS